MPIISQQDFVNAKRDIKDIGESVNLEKIIKPRWGAPYKSIPLIAKEAQLLILDWRNAINLITEKDGIPALAVSDSSGLNQQEINNLLPFYADKYESLSSAINNVGDSVSINLSNGVYMGGVALAKNDLNGVGYSSQIFVDANSYGIKTLRTLPEWDRTLISNMTIRAGAPNNNVGLLFDPDDPVAGRRNVEYVAFENLDIAIHKPAGNIGNTFSNLNIHDCNYAIRAMSTWTPIEMHPGNDTWRDFQIDNVNIWAFDYVDTTGGGAVSIKDGIIEYCEGGGIRIESSESLPPFIPPRISNVWFEGVAKANSVLRDGIAEKPSDLKLVNTAMCYIENCTLSSIELVNSTAIISNSRVDRLRDVTLTNSNLIVENAFLHGAVSKDLVISTIAKQSYPSAAGGDLTLRTVDKKGVIGQLSNALSQVGVTFQGNTGKFWEIYGSEQFYAISSNDGARLSLKNGLIYRLPVVNTLENSWVVWGISVRKDPSVLGDFKFNLDYNLGDIVFNDDGGWAHSFGIARTPQNSGTRMCATFTPSSDGFIEIKNYFIATFKSEAEALSFLNSKTALNTYPDRISIPYNPLTILNGELRITEIDFFGVSEGDNVVVSFNTNLKRTTLRAVVSSQNVVTVYHENRTGVDVVLDAGSLNLKLL